jgi:uncharacterized iron-regulated membrane protein
MHFNHTFRQSMSTLHTWCGIVFATLLFVIFWMGTLSVFDAEIDQWMKPELRFDTTAPLLSLDHTVKAMMNIKPDNARALSVSPSHERQPTLELWFRGDKGVVFPRYYVNPYSGEFIEPTDTLGGSKFLYRFHHRLHLTWNKIGVWIVGVAAMVMLLLLVTGLLTHRKIIIDLFTFRPKKPLGRSTLDLHTLSGLIAFPFYFMVCFSGLLISMETYFPWAINTPFNGDQALKTLEIKGGIKIKLANITNNSLASIDNMVAHAETEWTKLDNGEPAEVDAIRIGNLGDENSWVRIRRIFPDKKLPMNHEQMVFDASSGELIHEYVAGPIVTASSWIKGMHYIQYDHWPLRWLYFLGGLSGCIMIATGLLYWQRSRRIKHSEDPLNHRIVHTLTVGAISGTILATGAFFIVNRLLPQTIEFAGYQRSELEVSVFYLIWLLSFVHGAFRRQTAWKEQTMLIAIIAFTAPLLNWMTTGDHLIVTLQGNRLAVFGMDGVLILTGCIAIMITSRLRKFEKKYKQNNASLIRL